MNSDESERNNEQTEAPVNVQAIELSVPENMAERDGAASNADQMAASDGDSKPAADTKESEIVQETEAKADDEKDDMQPSAAASNASDQTSPEPPKKFKHPSSKRQQLTADDAVKIYQMRPTTGTGVSLKRGSMMRCKIIAPQFGVSAKTIRDIWRGRTWIQATEHLWTEEERAQRSQEAVNEESEGEAHSEDDARSSSSKKTDKTSNPATGSASHFDANQQLAKQPAPAPTGYQQIRGSHAASHITPGADAQVHPQAVQGILDPTVLAIRPSHMNLYEDITQQSLARLAPSGRDFPSSNLGRDDASSHGRFSMRPGAHPYGGYPANPLDGVAGMASHRPAHHGHHHGAGTHGHASGMDCRLSRAFPGVSQFLPGLSFDLGSAYLPPAMVASNQAALAEGVGQPTFADLQSLAAGTMLLGNMPGWAISRSLSGGAGVLGASGIPGGPGSATFDESLALQGSAGTSLRPIGAANAAMYLGGGAGLGLESGGEEEVLQALLAQGFLQAPTQAQIQAHMQQQMQLHQHQQAQMHLEQAHLQQAQMQQQLAQVPQAQLQQATWQQQQQQLHQAQLQQSQLQQAQLQQAQAQLQLQQAQAQLSQAQTQAQWQQAYALAQAADLRLMLSPPSGWSEQRP